jgi:nucleotide-binding universal stress UspA family protein
MYKNILIPTDGSKLSHKAIVTGVALAQAIGAKVTGLFAAPPATPLVFERHMEYVTTGQHEAMIAKTAAQYLGVIEREAAKAGVKCEVLHVTNDFPADAILAVAKKKKCDLICMASHGRRGIEGVVLGSETHKVLVHSKVPVLVCR